MSQGHNDYSTTPLARKLGIREGARMLLVSPPDGFTQMLSPLPDGVTFVTRASPGLDVVVWFATRRRDLRARFPRVARGLRPDGRLWLAWPKKASRVPTDIDFDAAQGVGLAAGLVDNKSASITDVFQGLQFVYRLRDRPLP
jgi:hypothetical protein